MYCLEIEWLNCSAEGAGAAEVSGYLTHEIFDASYENNGGKGKSGKHQGNIKKSGAEDRSRSARIPVCFRTQVSELEKFKLVRSARQRLGHRSIYPNTSFTIGVPGRKQKALESPIVVNFRLQKATPAIDCVYATDYRV
ncbi:hypothetical protein ACU8KH_00935 [Lachancea thermotolerans]